MMPLNSRSIASGAQQTAQSLENQWKNPSTVISILLIVAGDIVGQALAQLSGPAIVPVVFSFGWVSYASQAFISAIGLHELITPPKESSKSSVLDLDSQKLRHNTSWILNCLIRHRRHLCSSSPNKSDEGEADDHLAHTSDDKLGQSLSEPDLLEDVDAELRRPLRIFIFDCPEICEPRIAHLDRLWYAGIAVALVQLGIAAIPCGTSGEWGVLMVTGAGTILAFATGALPQFGQDKWKGVTHESGRTIALFPGDMEDATECVVIRDLSFNPFPNHDKDKPGQDQIHSKVLRKYTIQKHQVTSWPWTRSATAVLAACWVVLLIMVSSLRSNSWYLLGIGALGLAQNSLVAGSSRLPVAHGLHLEYRGFIARRDMARTLVAAERQYPKLGKALLKTFITDTGAPLRDAWWERNL